MPFPQATPEEANTSAAAIITAIPGVRPRAGVPIATPRSERTVDDQQCMRHSELQRGACPPRGAVALDQLEYIRRVAVSVVDACAVRVNVALAHGAGALGTAKNDAFAAGIILTTKTLERAMTTIVFRPARLTAIALAAALAVWTIPAAAEHRRDFMLTHSAYLPGADQLYLIARQDATWRSSDHRFELAPGVMYGVRDWLALGTHLHAGAGRSDSLSYDATRPFVQVRMTPRLSSLAIALRLDYLATRDRHIDDQVHAAGLVSYAANEFTYAFGIDYARETGSNGRDMWIAHGGVRAQVSRRVAYGLETHSGLTRRGSTELLLAAYVDPSPRFSVHIGAGSGIIRGPGITLRSELIWRLH
jgi:hypothetical protein